MAHSRSCLLLLAIIVLGAAIQPSPTVFGSPVISSANAQKQAATTTGPLAHDSKAPSTKSPVNGPKINVTDKLKRGLTNFINHLNPAPYFVPNSTVPGRSMASTREPPTITNDAPSADAVIKGSNRLVQTRPFGGPLRWGR